MRHIQLRGLATRDPGQKSGGKPSYMRRVSRFWEKCILTCLQNIGQADAEIFL